MVASSGFSTSMSLVQIGALTIPRYSVLASLVINLAVAAILRRHSSIFHAKRGRGETMKLDYQEAAL